MNHEPRTFELLAIFLILLIGAALRFHDLGRAELWEDEQVQLEQARKDSLMEVLRASDFQGPTGRLGWLDNAAAIMLGASTRSTYRIPQALEGLAAIIGIWLLGRRWFSSSAGLFAAALLAVSSLHVMYSRDARPYPLMVLLVLIQAAAFDWLIRKNTFAPALLLTLVTAVALGVHPLAGAHSLGLAAGAFAALLLHAAPIENIDWKRAAAFSAGAMFAAALPFAVLSRNMLDPHYLKTEIISTPINANSFFRDLYEIYKGLAGGYWGFASYLATAAIVLGIAAFFRIKEWRWPLCLSAGVALSGTVPVALSHLLGHFVVPRYSLFAMPFLFLLAGAGIDFTLRHFKREKDSSLTWISALSAPLLAALLIVSMSLQGRSPYDLEQSKKSKAGHATLPP